MNPPKASLTIHILLHLADFPQFDAEPSDDVRVFLGQTATFECRVSEESARHQPQISWLKDDQPLILDHRMKIMPSGLLEITDVKISDTDSDYRCNVVVLNGGVSQRSRAAKLKLKLDGGK